jgi:hypothetical protein
VSIGGHGYMLDLSFEPYRRDAFRHRSIPSTRPASDINNIPGENSINVEGLWRRAVEDWSHGAGQLYADKRTSDTSRFHQSKGINPWVPWQISLLNDTNRAYTTSNTNLYTVTVNGYLYLSDGNSVVRTADVTPGSPTWATLTGTPAVAVTAVTTDGTSIYSAHGSSGIYSALTSTTTAALFNSLSCTVLAYVKGRLMAAAGNKVYNIVTVPLTAPTGLALSTATTGGTLAAATYAYRVSATNAVGESVACTEVTQVTTGTTSTVTLTWNAEVGATGYKVYGRTSGGELLIASTTSTTYTDTGSVTPAGALPTNTSTNAPAPLYTHPNANFTWVGFCEGPAFIYGAGYAGGTSIIYRFGIATDGSALVAPIAAGTLPPGEIVYSIASYANTYLLIGTNLGVRFASIGSSGDISIGSIVPVNPGPTLPVRAFTSNSHFVWFGWSNYDATSTGLGRMDLQTFIDAETPAFASDLMATAQGEVLSVAYTQNLVCFAVSGVGLFAQTSTFVSSGTVDSGYIAYDIPDDKVAAFLDCRYVEPMTGSHQPFLSADRGAFVSIGQRTAGQGREPFSIPQIRGGEFEVRETLLCGASNSAGPTITRTILKSLPGVASGTTISPTIQFVNRVLDNLGGEFYMDIPGELAFLEGLRESQQIVTYQEGSSLYSVTVDSIDFLPYDYNREFTTFEGVCICYLKTISG